MFRRPAPRQCHGRAARASPLPDDALQSSRSQMRLRLHHRGSLASRAVRLGLSLALFLSLAASLASAEGGALPAAEPLPVASLEPAKTPRALKTPRVVPREQRAPGRRPPSAVRSGPSSTRRRTGFGSRRSSPNGSRRPPSTTSRFPPLVAGNRTRLRPNAAVAVPGRSGRNSTRWRRSTSRPGAGGWRRPEARRTRPA